MYRLFVEKRCTLMTVTIFNDVRQRLAFTKQKDMLLRGYFIQRFLNGDPNEWFKPCGLTREQAQDVIKTSHQKWVEVHKMTQVLSGDETADLKEQFNETDKFFKEKIRASELAQAKK